MQQVHSTTPSSIPTPMILAAFYAVAASAMMIGSVLALQPPVIGTQKLIGFLGIFSLSLIVGLAAGLVARARLSHLPDDHGQRLVRLNGLFVFTSLLAYYPMINSLTGLMLVGGVYGVVNGLLLWVAVQNRWLLSTAVSLPLIIAAGVMALDGGQVWGWGTYLVLSGVMVLAAARLLAGTPPRPANPPQPPPATQPSRAPTRRRTILNGILLGVLLVVVVMMLMVADNANIVVASVITLLFALGSSVLLFRLPFNPNRIGYQDLFAVLIISLSVFDVAFLHDIHHYNGYMAPINDILHGKTLGVDATSQYGVMLPYILAGIFQITGMPLNYEGFAVVNNVLLCVQYMAVYALLRFAVQSWWISLCGTLTIATVTLTTLFAPYIYPAMGPMRFMFLYFLLIAVALRVRRPAEQNWLGRLPEYVIIFMAWLWKYEAGVYTALTYGALVVFEMLFTRNTRSWGQRIAAILREAVITLACIAAALLVFVGYTWLRSGQFPNWTITFEIYQHYTTTEPIYSDLPTPGEAWILIIATYLAAATTIFYRMFTGGLPFEAKYTLLPVGVTIGGLLHFTYWLNNSTMAIARLIPPMMLMIIALYYVLRHTNRLQKFPAWGAQGITSIVLTVLLIFPFFDIRNTLMERTLTTILAPVFPTFAEQYDFTDGYRVFFDDQSVMAPFLAPRNGEPLLGEYLSEFDQMVAAEFPNQARITVIAPLDTTLTGLILNDRVNTLPISSPGIESFSQTATNRAVQSIQTLQNGDKLIMSWQFEQFWALQDALLVPLCETFSFIPQQQGEYLAVFVLAAPGEGACVCGEGEIVCEDDAP